MVQIEKYLKLQGVKWIFPFILITTKFLIFGNGPLMMCQEAWHGTNG